MSLIMDLIGPELCEFSALELENLPYLTLFILLHLSWSVLWQDTLARAQPSTGETQERMKNVSCRHDMTEIVLKVA